MLEALKSKSLISLFWLYILALVRSQNLYLRLNTYKCRTISSKPICLTRSNTTLTFLPMYTPKPNRF